MSIRPLTPSEQEALFSPGHKAGTAIEHNGHMIYGWDDLADRREKLESLLDLVSVSISAQGRYVVPRAAAEALVGPHGYTAGGEFIPLHAVVDDCRYNLRRASGEQFFLWLLTDDQRRAIELLPLAAADDTRTITTYEGTLSLRDALLLAARNNSHHERTITKRWELRPVGGVESMDDETDEGSWGHVSYPGWPVVDVVAGLLGGSPQERLIAAVDATGQSVRGAAKRIGIDSRKMRRWISGEEEMLVGDPVFDRLAGLSRRGA